ncbi:MAG: apolipoprotein N-acyltransferase, partial [Hoeflea sp.]
DSAGRIAGSLPLGEKGVFDVELPPSRSPYWSNADREINFGLTIGIMVFVALVARRSKKFVSD